MFVKFSCAFISDLSEKISALFPVSDKISGKQPSSFCQERKLFGTGLFSNKLSLISWSKMRFKSLPLGQFFHFLLSFLLFFFVEDLVENLDGVCSSWEISSFEDP